MKLSETDCILTTAFGQMKFLLLCLQERSFDPKNIINDKFC